MLRVLKRMFWPNRGEIIEIWRKLHNDELHNLYPSPNITVNETEMIRVCSMHGRGRRNAYRALVGKPDG
jgi:hypothetical protein